MELLTSEEISRLSPPERIARLWDSLEQDQIPLSPAQQDELDRRLASLDEDRAESVSWTALNAELERRCP